MKPSPAEAIEILKQGNARFAKGEAVHPHSDSSRLVQAGVENQADHAIATILGCSDSRCPVERIFDAGVMDLFVIRVAGNVVNTDEAGSIEYGLLHVKTPVLVVLGHTQCGAVTAVTQAVLGQGQALERNIPPLVAPIQPAVEKAMKEHPQKQGLDIVPDATEQNVWQAIENLFMRSPAVRDLINRGDAKVVGAVYDVGTGKVTWLPEEMTSDILQYVESHPEKETEPMA